MFYSFLEFEKQSYFALPTNLLDKIKTLLSVITVCVFGKFRPKLSEMFIFKQQHSDLGFCEKINVLLDRARYHICSCFKMS